MNQNRQENIGVTWEEGIGGNRSGVFREEYSEQFLRRRGLLDRLGNFRNLHADAQRAALVADGDLARWQIESDNAGTVLDCGCVYQEGMQLKQTPAGYLVDSKCFRICGRSGCDGVIEPVPENPGIYLPSYKRFFHRPCTLAVLEDLMWQRRRGIEVGIEPAVLAQYRSLRQQLQRERRQQRWQRLANFFNGHQIGNNGHVPQVIP